MLIGDPLVEGSSASSTDGELWRAENSFLGMRGTHLPMRSSRAENSLLRVRPIDPFNVCKHRKPRLGARAAWGQKNGAANRPAYCVKEKQTSLIDR